MKKLIFTGLAALALIALVVTAFGVTSTAFAQSSDPTETPEAVTPDERPSRQGDGFETKPFRGSGKMPGDFNRMGALQEYLLNAQADAFGVTVDDLQALYDEGKSLQDLAIEQNLSLADYEAKMDAAYQNALEQAVADEVITQDQADAMLERKQNMPTDRPDHDVSSNNPLHDYIQTATANAFGLTVDELQALSDEGKTLKDVAIEQDLSVADYQAKLESARQEALAAAVADGVLTQEQADALQEHFDMGPGGKLPGGMGHPGGRGRGGMRGGDCPSPTTPEDTSTDPNL